MRICYPKFKEIKKSYEIEISFDADTESKVFGNLLKTDRLSIMFSPEGNIEFLAHLTLSDHPGIDVDTERVVMEAHETLKG